MGLTQVDNVNVAENLNTVSGSSCAAPNIEDNSAFFVDDFESSFDSQKFKTIVSKYEALTNISYSDLRKMATELDKTSVLPKYDIKTLALSISKSKLESSSEDDSKTDLIGFWKNQAETSQEGKTSVQAKNVLDLLDKIDFYQKL